MPSLAVHRYQVILHKIQNRNLGHEFDALVTANNKVSFNIFPKRPKILSFGNKP